MRNHGWFGGKRVGNAPRLMLAWLLLFSALVLPSDAEARRGFAIFNTGEQIFETGPLPESLGQTDGNWQAGYKCSVAGVFWAYVHWWDCQAVAVQGESYSDEPEVAAAIRATYSQSDMQIGLWGRGGRFLLIPLIGLMVVGRFSGED